MEANIISDSYKALVGYGVLGIVTIGLVIAIIYLVRWLDRKDAEIARLNALLLADSKEYGQALLKANLDWSSFKDSQEAFLAKLVEARRR